MDVARVGHRRSIGAMQDDAGDIDSSDEDGASDFRASKWLRARPRVVPQDALILTSSAAFAAAAFTSAQAWEDYGRKVPGRSERGQQGLQHKGAAEQAGISHPVSVNAGDWSTQRQWRAAFRHRGTACALFCVGVAVWVVGV
jgi:hypothetical protein